MRVSELWLIYILVIVAVYIVLSVTKVGDSVERSARVFFALLIGAVVVFIFLPSVNLTTPDDRTWYSLLLLIVFLLPLFIAAWILWQQKNSRGIQLEEPKSFLDQDAGHVLKRHILCDANGVCDEVGVTKKYNGQVYDIKYT